MPMQCPSCNTTLAIEAHFCPNCGARLAAPDEPAAPGGARVPGSEPRVVEPSDPETVARDEPLPDELETAAQPSTPGATQRGQLALRAGQEFGPYHLIRMLGRGGFGQVWEAESLETGRRLALKVLMTSPAAAEEEIERFKREGRLAAALSHPNCVYVFSAEQIDGRPVITMELMPGGTLQDLLKKGGPLPYRTAVDYALQIVEGLDAADAAGVIHRDIKPSNCFLDPSGSVRIGDFGLSKTLDVDSSLTATGSFLGTPAYCSPEQVKGRDVDSSSDIYAVGATLYALLTGKPPFVGEGGAQVLARILSEPPTPFSAHAARVPKGLQKVVMRLLAKDKSKRYPTYAALRAALRPYSSRGATTGGLGGRLAAVVIDFVLIHAVGASIMGTQFLYEPATVRNQLALLVLMFAYFASQEWLWGRTIGKHLLGLRVMTVGGEAPTFGTILPRAGLFSVALHAPLLIETALNPGRSSQELTSGFTFWIFCVALPYAALLGTLRRRNGFAALHDLVSRTRVNRVAAQQRYAIPDRMGEQAAEAAPSPRRFGPYEEIRPVWQTRDEALLVARDAELHRDVWIHRFEDEARAPTRSSLSQDRPGRLHWLHGSRNEGDQWDAYEAPSGIGLFEWVEVKGRLPWIKLREILLDVAEELDARQAQGEPPRPLSVRHIWVDRHGQARLLDFPSSLETGRRAEELASQDWRAFLHQLLLFGCEGQLLTGEQLESRIPRVPLPEHTRPFVQRLCGLGQPLASPAEAVAELRGLVGRSAGISRRRRLGPLMITAAPSLFMLFSLTLATVAAGEAMKLVLQYGRCGSALRILGSENDGPEQQEDRRLVQLLRAETYAQLLVAAAPPSNTMSQQIAKGPLDTIPPDERQAMDELLREHPPTADELDAGRRVLDALRPTTGSLMGLVLGILLYLTVAPLAIPALIFAPIFRGGALLALFGMRLQTLDGRPAGRLRCLLRAVLVWAPLGLFRFWAPWAVLNIAFPLVVAIGIGYTLCRPERSIPDLIARTQLVPR